MSSINKFVMGSVKLCNGVSKVVVGSVKFVMRSVTSTRKFQHSLQASVKSEMGSVEFGNEVCDKHQ